MQILSAMHTGTNINTLLNTKVKVPWWVSTSLTNTTLTLITYIILFQFSKNAGTNLTVSSMKCFCLLENSNPVSTLNLTKSVQSCLANTFLFFYKKILPRNAISRLILGLVTRNSGRSLKDSIKRLYLESPSLV